MQVWHAIVFVVLVAAFCFGDAFFTYLNANDAVARAEREAQEQKKILDSIVEKSARETERLRRLADDDSI